MKIWIIEIGYVQRGMGINWEFYGATNSKVEAIEIMLCLHETHEHIKATQFDMSRQTYKGYSINIIEVLNEVKKNET